MSHFGPPDSIRRRVERPLSREGASSFSEPARRAGRPFTRLSGLSHRGRERQGEAAFARSASARLQKCPPHHRTRRPRPGDPLHDEPFRATRQHSTTRGEAPFQRGGLQLFRASQTGRKAIYQAVWPLPQGQGEAGGGRFCTKRFC